MESVLFVVCAMLGGVVVGIGVGSIVPRLRVMIDRPVWQQLLTVAVVSLIVFQALYWPVVLLVLKK